MANHELGGVSGIEKSQSSHMESTEKDTKMKILQLSNLKKTAIDAVNIGHVKNTFSQVDRDSKIPMVLFNPAGASGLW